MINLHGTWNYQIGAEGDDNLIPADFKANENLFIMPGTTNENHIGIPLDESNLTEKEQLKCLREHFSFIV